LKEKNYFKRQAEKNGLEKLFEKKRNKPMKRSAVILEYRKIILRFLTIVGVFSTFPLPSSATYFQHTKIKKDQQSYPDLYKVLII